MSWESEFKQVRQEELYSRQDQFANLFDPPIDAELIRELQFCPHCGGEDYQWTDWSMNEIDTVFMDADDNPQEYRMYLLESLCQKCDGTGFKGGSWRLEREDWLKLSSIPNNRAVS